MEEHLILSDGVKLHDEAIERMQECLYAAEKHAIVCGQEVDADLVDTAEKYLPRYSRIIRPKTECVLIKKSVIDSFGLPEANNEFESLEYKLLDYFLRINEFGYTAVTAHHAFYEQGEGDSEECGVVEKAGLRRLGECGVEADAEKFSQKYGFFAGLEEHFNRTEVHPCLKFLRLLSNDKKSNKKILFVCTAMQAHHNGTSEYQISMFDAFNRLYGEKYELYMYMSREVDEYHKLSERYNKVLYPDTIGDKVFHLGFFPMQLYHIEDQIETNKRCLMVVQTVFDIIQLRCLTLRINAMQCGNNMRMAFGLCDGIITISESTMKDLSAYFPDEMELRKIPVKQIHIAIDNSKHKEPKHDNYKLPFDEYFLIVGNSFRHKAIQDAIDAVCETAFNYIIIGINEHKFSNLTFKNIHGYKSGRLDEDFLNYLYHKTKAIIFPSQYEGFGLPIAKGLVYQKRVILANTDVNRELYEHFSEFQDYFLFFDRFEQIGDIVKSTDFSIPLEPVDYADTWDTVAMDTEAFFKEILDKEVDAGRLRERWHLYNAINEDGAAKLQHRIKGHLEENLKLLDENLRIGGELAVLYSQFGDYKLSTMMRFAVKEFVKHRCKGLYERLKG